MFLLDPKLGVPSFHPLFPGTSGPLGMPSGSGSAAAHCPPHVSRDPDSISSNHQHYHLLEVIKWCLNSIQKSHRQQPSAGAAQISDGLEGSRGCPSQIFVSQSRAESQSLGPCSFQIMAFPAPSQAYCARPDGGLCRAVLCNPISSLVP